MFLAFANEREDERQYLRNLPLEARRLRDTLDHEATQSLWEIVERRNATLDEILDVFLDRAIPQLRQKQLQRRCDGTSTVLEQVGRNALCETRIDREAVLGSQPLVRRRARDCLGDTCRVEMIDEDLAVRDHQADERILDVREPFLAEAQ